MTTGLDLKFERMRAGLTARQIARQMQVSHQRVSYIETRQFVPADAAIKYREALRQLATAPQNVA